MKEGVGEKLSGVDDGNTVGTKGDGVGVLEEIIEGNDDEVENTVGT